MFPPSCFETQLIDFPFEALTSYAGPIRKNAEVTPSLKAGDLFFIRGTIIRMFSI
jgi:hypothetical protein